MTASMFASSADENLQPLPLNAYPPKQYIVGPIFDLLFVCGGFTVLLSLLYFWPPLRSMLGPSADELSASLLFAGTYLLSQPHLGASLRRLYGEPENMAKHRHVALALPVVMLISLLVAFRVLGPTVTMDWLTSVYLILIVHHVLAQSYGIALMYCGRSTFVMGADEKQLFKDILYLAVAVAVIGQSTGRHNLASASASDAASVVAGFHLPFVFLQIAIAALLVLVLCFFNAQLRRAALGEATMPLPAVAVMLVSLVAVVLSQAVDNIFWIFIPAFFHASQYLAVVVAYKWKDYKLSQAACENKLKPVLAFVGAELHSYFLVGLTLSVAIPCALFFIGMRDIDPFKLMFLLVSLHHFATDACLWKLRQPRVQERLV
jgi:hypothetical protein